MKHKMWSRLLSMVLAVMMIASIVPSSAFAEAASEIVASSQATVEVAEETEEVTLPEEETPAAEEPVAVEPTAEPAPTEEPVAEPTAEPVTESEQPAAEPTQAPAETAMPSEQPSAEPTAAPEGTETPEGTAVPSETPAASATPAPSESPVPSETPVPTETPAPSEEPAIDGQALLDELMAIEDDEAFMQAVSELTEEQTAALEALGEEALADYALRVETLTAQEETVELNAEAKEFTTAVEGVDGVTVTVKVPEGALPVDAELKADLIAEDSEEYTKAEQALSEQEETYDGMVALDIRFELNGEEVEPLKEVEVSIDAQALLPEEADPETVAVQHLKEDVTGEVVAVETVADATEETGEVTVEAAPAEEAALNVASTFAVDGFSTFTITWTVDYGWPIGEDENKITFVAYDTEGNRIELPHDVTLDLGTYGSVTGNESDVYYFETELSRQGVLQITYNGEDYVFQRAHCFDGAEKAHPVDSFQIVRDVDLVWKLRMYDMVYGGESGFYSRDNGESTVELIYRKSSESDVDDVYIETDLQKEKKVTWLDDGQDTYELELSVSGKVGSITNPVKLDVVFVIDQSSSMREAIEGGTNRTDAVQDAVKTLVDSFQSNKALDVRYGLVHFASDLLSDNEKKYYQDGITTIPWTKDTQSIIDAAGIPADLNKGTNYQAGLIETRGLLLDSRPNAQRYVIFLSDGQPTYYYDDKGDQKGNGSNTTDEVISATREEADLFTNINGFFSVRVGNEENADAILQAVCDAAKVEGAGIVDSNFKNYPAEDVPQLQKAFEDIQGNITQLLCDDVEVSDQLSENVVSAGDCKLTVYDGDHEVTEIINPNQVWASFSDGVLKINFSDEYTLQKNYTYKVTMPIRPSEEAYAKYANSGERAYTDEADAGTGTYEKQMGLKSNGTAKVTYQFNGEEQSNDFLQPVIQVHPGELTITKEIKGDILEDSAKLGNLKNALKFEVTLNNGKPFVIELPAVAGENGVYTITDKQLKNLKPGTTYTIEEIGFNVEGYDCEPTVNSEVGTTVSGVISASTTTPVAFVNDYTALDGKLTFTKTLESLCDGDTMALFTIEIKDGEGNSYYKTLKFAKSGDQSFTITLPVGSYQIRELQTSGYTNGTITGANGGPDENGYYSFTVPAGDQINLSVINTAKKKNPSIDTNIAINSFSNDGNNWTWVRK